MSVKIPKRLSSKKKKPPVDNTQQEVLFKLGLEAFWTTPLDPASMLDISTWTLDNQAPLTPKYLPLAFLQRLWLLSPEARSTCCKPAPGALDNANTSGDEMVHSLGGDTQCAVNPLDLVTAVYLSANSFLQQEITVRMVQCQFAVPLVLPAIHPQQPSCFLLWPLRGVVSQWRSQFPDQITRVLEGDLASTEMPMVSCVKLGRCGVSKSWVLNHVIGGHKPLSESFLHRGMDGGQLPRRLSNGLVELGWYLPTGDPDGDIFPVPVAISNLRGDAAAHEKCLSLLCRASSAVVVFCGNLREKEKCLLASLKGMSSKLILIDLSDAVEEKNEKRVVAFVTENLEEELRLPKGSVLPGGAVSEEELADRLRETLRNLLPDKLKLVTLEAAARIAVELGLSVDEGAVCKKAMATVEEVLKGLNEGPDQFREKQLPLQGVLWSKLAEMEKEEIKQRKAEEEINLPLQKEMKNILLKLSSYRMTTAMKAFTDALFTTDKMERSYFLSWMKLKLRAMQMRQQCSLQEPSTNQQDQLYQPSLGNVVTKKKDDEPKNSDELENGTYDYLEDSDSFCTVSTVEEVKAEEQPVSMCHTGNSGEQLSEQQFQIGWDLSTEQSMEPESPQKGQLESMLTQLNMKPAKREHGKHYPVSEQEMDLKSTEKESMGREVVDNQDSFEEQISDTEILTGQNLHLEFAENGSCQGKQHEQPKLKANESDSNASAKTYMGLEASTENQAALGTFAEQYFEPHPSSLGLEHFLREMGLIFELTHISPGSGSHNVLRLPSLAADLLLYGIPLELMDGDASNIPRCWLGRVLAEFKRRLPQEQARTRVLTNLGVHQARNAEVLSALFGVKFPGGGRRSTRGVYMLALCLPNDLRKDMECDLLLLIDVEGLCSPPLVKKQNTQIQDNEMATVATGLSDVLMQNIWGSYGDTEFVVIVNALLRTEVCGSTPICQLLTQDEGLNSKLQALQLGRIAKILQTNTEEKVTNNTNYPLAKDKSSIPCVKGPWHNISLSQPVDKEYSKAVLKLKENLFGALKKCAAKSKAFGLPEFMGRLCAVWEVVKAESFSIGLQSTEVAVAFSMLCTELSQWENDFLEHMEAWFMGAKKRIIATKTKALETGNKNDLLSVLKDEARVEVITEVNKLRSKLEAYLMKDHLHKTYIETYRPNLMNNMDELQKQVTEEIMERLESAKEFHYSSTQLRNFQTTFEKERESKLHTLVENSKSTKILLEDIQLEEEFEAVWSNALSNFEFRPSETDDITERVTQILRENLISRGHQKHMRKLEDLGQKSTFSFKVHDEHFGYQSRVKHMFKDNNRQQRLEAHQLACNIIEESNQFVADKSSLLADFSDSYITELLQNVERALRVKPMEIRSSFEVDLKVYVCSFACQDFQKIHDRYAKDRDLLTFINGTKNRYLGEFIYQFRKRDQCQRVAQAFTTMVFKPTALDYIYRPLGRRIMEEMVSQDNAQQYQSPWAFNQSLLEELMEEDSFESFLEYLLSYESFRLRKIQERVVAHLSRSTILDEWMQQRLGEIVGKMAVAVSQTAEGVSGVLSDTKLLLEKLCLTLEKDGDVNVTKAPLDGPLFSITAEWDRFVTCLLEALAEMRLALVQEFQNVDITQFLQTLPIKAQDCLFHRVRGCEKQCPFCRAPCQLGEMEHEVHRALLHRPKGLLSHTCSDSCSLSHTSCPADVTQDSLFLNKDSEGKSLAYRDYHLLNPDWSISPEELDSQATSAYWRYVLVRFNGRFAEEYEQEPAQLPEEWKKITREEALDSLKEAFHIEQC